MIVYLARDIPAFVMCIYGASGSSLLIESVDSMMLTLSRARVIIARKSTGHAFLASFNRNTAHKRYPYC